MRVTVIGGGIVGLATAWRLLETQPGWQVTVVEKEQDVGRHQSGHNSGVLHAGLYYAPGSQKARLAVSGIRQMIRYAQERRIPYDQCGKLVVATTDREVSSLRLLAQRGESNGLSGIRWLERDQIRRLEPNCGGIAALHVPEEGIIDYRVVCRSLADDIRSKRGTIRTGFEVREIRRQGREWVIRSKESEAVADFLIGCGGLHSDRIATMTGQGSATRIIPFRGEYYRLRPSAAGLVHNLIYPVPDPTFPFLGVHFTRLISGGVEAGPNAVLALAREGYRKADVNLRDTWDAVTYGGLWKFLKKYPRMCAAEIRRSFSRRSFANALRALVPDLRDDDLEPGGAGVRAQAMSADGTLLQDFAFVRHENALHVVNAPSPGATASLAIGEEIVRMMGAA